MTGQTWGRDEGSFPPSRSDVEPTEYLETLVVKQQVLDRARSPYILRKDLIVEPSGELVIEPGVEVRFAPMTGITVRGQIVARVSHLGRPQLAVSPTAK